MDAPGDYIRTERIPRLSISFRRFTKDFSRITRPLTNLTKKGNSIAIWDNQWTEAMGPLKQSLVTAPLPSHPNFRKPLKCHVEVM